MALPAFLAKTTPELRLRSFGIEPGDLEIHFQSPRPGLAIALLQACAADGQGRALDSGILWEWPVGFRTELLLRIAFLTRPRPLDVTMACGNADCGQKMEVEFQEQDLVNQSPWDRPVAELRLGDHIFRFRRPSGQDQKQWLEQAPADEGQAFGLMLRTLIAADQQPPFPFAEVSLEVMQQLDHAMAELDPLTGFHVTVACPHCGLEQTQPMDLEQLAIEILHSAQRSVLDAVHVLAGHYHWSEQEILAIAPWRRRIYLQKIGAES